MMRNFFKISVTPVFCIGALFMAFAINGLHGQSKHGVSSQFTSYRGRIMCGYQGWFRVPEDGAGRGYIHWGAKGQFGKDSYCTVDVWPDVSEYPVTYPSGFFFEDGSEARIFSSYDYSTVDTHFRWMQENGIDGVFVQRFFSVASKWESDTDPLQVLRHTLTASQKYGRAIALMYDLSGIRPGQDDCSTLIEDWKQLVDELKLTNQGNGQTYLYHNGKPLVAIWGIGFPDRTYNIRDIKILEFIDFLKNDPEYGGCSVMLGVPCYFRDLNIDCLKDPFVHEVIESVDIVMPWMVQRFNSVLQQEAQRYFAHVAKDIQWCKERELEYVPVIYPGMSWFNLSTLEQREHQPLNGIPRLRGHLYWMMIDSAIHAGAEMLYVAMFDELDEATAILKLRNNGPQSEKFAFLDMENVPSDYYLWLTGEGGKHLRNFLEIDQ